MNTTVQGSTIAPSSGKTAAQLYADMTQNYASARDPYLKCTIAFQKLSASVSGVMEMRANEVQDLANQMADVHDLISTLNSQLQALANAPGNSATSPDTTNWTPYQSSATTDQSTSSAQYKDVLAFYQRLLAAGVQSTDVKQPAPLLVAQTSPAGTYRWTIQMTKGQMNSAIQAMQGKVEDLSNDSQQKQLKLQNLMNQFNNEVEAITQLIAKFSKQGQDAAGTLAR